MENNQDTVSSYSGLLAKQEKEDLEATREEAAASISADDTKKEDEAKLENGIPQKSPPNSTEEGDSANTKDLLESNEHKPASPGQAKRKVRFQITPTALPDTEDRGSIIATEIESPPVSPLVHVQIESSRRSTCNSDSVASAKELEEDHDLEGTHKTRKTLFHSIFIQECKTKLFVSGLCIVIIASVALIVHFYQSKLYEMALGKRVMFYEDTRLLEVRDAERNIVLEGSLAVGLQGHPLPNFCHGKPKDEEFHKGIYLDEACLVWEDRATLYMNSHAADDTNTSYCYDISWQSHTESFIPQDCFSLDGAYWYGGGLMFQQKWPMNSVSHPKIPFTVGSRENRDTFGPVVEPYWISSHGVNIYVDPETPLHISWRGHPDKPDVTDNSLCLYGDYTNISFSRPFIDAHPFLNYTICVGSDMREVHEKYLETFKTPPEASPNVALFLKPVWSTGGYFKRNISQDALMLYSQRILDSGLDYSALVLDDGWESRYGDLEFNPVKFSNPKAMINDLQSKGFSVVMGIKPYVELDSAWFVESVKEGILIRDGGGEVSGLTKLHGQDLPRVIVGALDVTDISQNWTLKRLQNFSTEYSIHSFSLTGGESDNLPYRPNFGDGISSSLQYAGALSRLVSRFGDLAQSRIGANTQDIPLVVRLHGSESSWSDNNGLAHVLPAVLTLGLLGYPFVLSDAIGGNAYEKTPSEELYIRWLQLSTFVPMVHFSIPPFAFSNETQELAVKLMHLRRREIAPEIQRVLPEAMQHLLPIVRPLWWGWPSDNQTFTVESQFLVGDHILVAPVLQEGVRHRDLYLPTGSWLDKVTNDNYVGPKWLRDYPVPRDTVPWFVLVSTGQSQ